MLHKSTGFTANIHLENFPKKTFQQGRPRQKNLESDWMNLPVFLTTNPSVATTSFSRTLIDHTRRKKCQIRAFQHGSARAEVWNLPNPAASEGDLLTTNGHVSLRSFKVISTHPQDITQSEDEGSETEQTLFQDISKVNGDDVLSFRKTPGAHVGANHVQWAQRTVIRTRGNWKHHFQL